MAGPISIANADSRKIDTIYLPDGSKMIKMGIGSYANVGDMGDADGAGQLVGTHLADGDTLIASEAIVVIAGVDGTVNDPIVPMLVDSTGRPMISTGLTDSQAAAGGDQVLGAAFLYNEAGDNLLADGDIGMMRVTEDRKGLVAANIRPEATAGSGKTPYFALSAASTQDVNIKAAPGKVFNVEVNNINAARRYLKLYDKASAPGSGDTPVAVFEISAAGKCSVNYGESGLEFTLGIGYRITTGIANNDTGAASASEHAINIAYV